MVPEAKPGTIVRRLSLRDRSCRLAYYCPSLSAGRTAAAAAYGSGMVVLLQRCVTERARRMAYLYYTPRNRNPRRWPTAVGLLVGFVVLYALGSVLGIVQP